MSKPINMLSFEFTPELIDSTVNCIKYLNSIGMGKYNYSTGESMEYILPNWVGYEEVVKELQSLKGDTKVFGDVYVAN